MEAAFKLWIAGTVDADSATFKQSADLIYAAWKHGKKTGMEVIGGGLPKGTIRVADAKKRKEAAC